MNLSKEGHIEFKSCWPFLFTASSFIHFFWVKVRKTCWKKKSNFVLDVTTIQPYWVQPFWSFTEMTHWGISNHWQSAFCSTACWDWQQRKFPSCALLALCEENLPVYSLHKGPTIQKGFRYHVIIIGHYISHDISGAGNKTSSLIYFNWMIICTWLFHTLEVEDQRNCFRSLPETLVVPKVNGITLIEWLLFLTDFCMVYFFVPGAIEIFFARWLFSAWRFFILGFALTIAQNLKKIPCIYSTVCDKNNFKNKSLFLQVWKRKTCCTLFYVFVVVALENQDQQPITGSCSSV